MNRSFETSLPKATDSAVPRRWRWGLISLCWLVWGLFYASRLRLDVPGIDWARSLQYALPDAILWIFLTPVPVEVYRRFPFRRGQRLAHLALHLVAAVAVALAHTALDAWLSLAQGDPAPFRNVFSHLIYYGFHVKILLYSTIVGIAHYLARMDNLRQERQRASELRAQLSEARLEALRLQLRPHFLFNVLNTISGLMPQDPATGQRVVRQLGELLRMSLSDRDRREVPLSRELELARAYLEIEQLRFRDRLTTRIEAPEDTLDCAVPPFILQPILENAVRHGMRPEGGSEIAVSAFCGESRLELRVIDNGPGLGPSAGPGDGNGIGLANTRARLRELYGESQELRIESGDEQGTLVTLHLPRRSMARDHRVAVR